ncbi:MAG: biotin transporter BioY [Pseudomonadota bacterium]
MTRDMTLSQATLGTDGLLRKALLVLGGSAFIAVASKIAVPMGATSMTLGSLAVLLVGLTYGSRLAATTLLTYLAAGAAGLPMFTITTAPGLAAFVGPTAGFLFGYVMIAWFAGYVTERGVKSFFGLALTALAASALLYVPGLAWPALIASGLGIEGSWIPSSLDTLLNWYMLPFLLGDAIKALIAALVVSGSWKVLRKT